jgi:TPR repeat protein
MLALHMTEVPAAAQGRPLAPIEGRVLGVKHVLTPMVKELRRRCTCVSAAFAEPRVPYYEGERGEGVPLRLVNRERRVRSGLEQEWRDLVAGGGARALTRDAGTYEHWNAAAILVTGRGFGRLQGQDAIRAGVRLYALAAEEGHGEAQADLAYLYMTGLGVPRSDEAAAYWYLRGAANGSHLARLALGAMYAVGRGVPQSDAAAVYWFAQANQHHFVADAYACGFGVEQDLPLARKLYQEIAEKGDPDAQFQLGTMFSNACGGPLDDTEAAKWYEAAADNGHPEAQIALSHIMRQGLGIAPNAIKAYHWAEMAVLRLEDDEALNDALVARAAAGPLLTPEQRDNVSVISREVVRVSSEAERETR